ncbi:MAG TPA: TetR/AcrR family transcriptional regulator C-terminal domain-containing protein [Streptosporangiaceae bacterium]
MSSGPEDLWPPFGHPWQGGRPGAGRPGGGRPGDRTGDRAGGRPGDRPGGGRDPRDPRGGQAARRASGREIGGRGHRHRSSLSQAEIVDAAIAVADAEGAAAISMRRIAQVLQAGTMSLYWHVENKEHLLDLMLDTVLGETEVPDAGGDWRAVLRAIAFSERALLHRHRWVMDFIGGRPPLGPHVIANLERSLTALDSLQLGTAIAMNVLMTVNTYVMGAVLREMRELRAQRDLEASGLDTTEIETGVAEWARRLRADGRFGHFLRIIEEDVDPDAEDTRDERFEFGLDCVLDGIAARVQPADLRKKADTEGGQGANGVG